MSSAVVVIVVMLVVDLVADESVEARGHELAVEDPFGTDEAIRQATDVSEQPLEHDDLEAVSVVDVDVHARDDVVAVVVLNRRQPARQGTSRMIVDDGHRADGLDILRQLCLDEIVPYEVSERLGPIGDAPICEEPIELAQ